MKNISGGM